MNTDTDTGGPSALRRLAIELYPIDHNLDNLAAQWEAERESFYSDFRMKYDIETKKLYTELERERAALAATQKRLQDFATVSDYAAELEQERAARAEAERDINALGQENIRLRNALYDANERMGAAFGLNDRARTALAEAEKRLHDCTSLAEVERNAQRAIWKELRDLFDCKPNESLVGVCNQTVSRLEQARALLREYLNGEPQDATWRFDFIGKVYAALRGEPATAGGETK